MVKRIPINDLLRKACYLAEEYERDFVRCIEKSDPEDAAESREFIRQLHEYRMKRWGKSKIEKFLDEGVAVPVSEIAKGK